MSRRKNEKDHNPEFVRRLVEICDSTQPSEVARTLGISYQAAKNYLSGRIPDSKVLQQLAGRMPYSLHWLLTGVGNKYAEPEKVSKKDTNLLSDALQAFIREQCVKIVGEILQNTSQIVEQPSGERIIVLASHQIKEEKIIEEVENLSSK